jgi:hypothetical protein
MTIHDELVALREEVAKLRERVAVLESKQVSHAPMPHLQWGPTPYAPPVWVAPNTMPIAPWSTITCTQ